jgi:hypothetical protein
MSWFKRKEESTATMEPAPECLHVALIPHWDNLDDIGHEDRATSYLCEACTTVFTAEDAHHLRETEVARLSRIN